MVDKILGDEEVARETHRLDDAQLVVQPFLNLGRAHRVARFRAFESTFVGEVAQEGIAVGVLRRNGEVGQ